MHLDAHGTLDSTSLGQSSGEVLGSRTPLLVLDSADVSLPCGVQLSGFKSSSLS